LEATEESFDTVVSTNLKGPYFLTQAVARHMATQDSGRIVFVTSVSSYTSSTNRGEYCVSKAGLSMAVKLYADRLAQNKVGVFEIRPGIIQTDMIAKVRDKYEDLAEQGLLPQGRLGLPQDVAKSVRAIATGLLDYSTGQVLNVDGGFHIRRL
jgi:3-oxoacyl-[acyl-carrier protein] reductase